jgi:hypothetical protein
VAGSAGWRINGDGTAEFSGVVVRGTIFASAGLIGGITIAANAVRAGQTAYNTGSGFHLGSDGRFSLGNSAGNRLTFNGTDIEVETPNFSLSNGSARLSGQVVAGGVELGADVGPGTGHYGLSLSGDNFNDIFIKRHDGVRFFRVNEGGSNYISFESAGGNLNIKSAGFSVINGTMTINQANVINTLNLAGGAVTVPMSAATTATLGLGNQWATLQTLAINAEGAPIVVISSAMIEGENVEQGGEWFSVRGRFRLLRNGGDISGELRVQGQGTIHLRDTPGAGEHSYTLQCLISPYQTGFNYRATHRVITALGVKR